MENLFLVVRSERSYGRIPQLCSDELVQAHASTFGARHLDYACIEHGQVPLGRRDSASNESLLGIERVLSSKLHGGGIFGAAS